MVYSYTQISQYLRCPRSYRYRYLDGWREKETRAAMVFGRCFEKALGAYFCQEDSAALLFKEWEVKVARKDREAFDCATWLHKARELPKEGFKGEVERHLTGKETEAWEIIYFKLLQEPVTCS